jgi:hypothetical protein
MIPNISLETSEYLRIVAVLAVRRQHDEIHSAVPVDFGSPDSLSRNGAGVWVLSPVMSWSRNQLRDLGTGGMDPALIAGSTAATHRTSRAARAVRPRSSAVEAADWSTRVSPRTGQATTTPSNTCSTSTIRRPRGETRWTSTSLTRTALCSPTSPHTGGPRTISCQTFNVNLGYHPSWYGQTLRFNINVYNRCTRTWSLRPATPRTASLKPGSGSASASRSGRSLRLRNRTRERNRWRGSGRDVLGAAGRGMPDSRGHANRRPGKHRLVDDRFPSRTGPPNETRRRIRSPRRHRGPARRTTGHAS